MRRNQERARPSRAGERFSWQEAYAKVLPQGDLEWTPLPFHFEKGHSVRYIDFDVDRTSRSRRPRKTRGRVGLLPSGRDG